jgi:hypothetical protein
MSIITSFETTIFTVHDEMVMSKACEEVSIHWSTIQFVEREATTQQQQNEKEERR